ncbi:hypothetical protein GCM10027605_33910 [Micromonospora zhanjiangensis]
MTYVFISEDAAGYVSTTSSITARAAGGASGLIRVSTSVASRVPGSGAVSTTTEAPRSPGSWESRASQSPHIATQMSTWSGSTREPPSGSQPSTTVYRLRCRWCSTPNGRSYGSRPSSMRTRDSRPGGRK